MPIKQIRYWLLVLLVIFTSISMPIFGTSNRAYADYTPTGDKCNDGSTPTKVTVPGSTTTKLNCTGSSDSGAGAGNSDTTKKETCAIERVGWIVCPIIHAAAVISDKAFKILSDSFLRTDPQLVSNNSGTKVAWEIARNIANVMFIIAFLVIIISQITGMGLNNYGIKRMIPRLLIAAIAVNISYYICQLAVDLTNVLGYEVQGTLKGVAESIGPSVFGNAQDFTGGQHETGIGDGLLTVIAVGALGAAAVVWLTLPLLMSVILFILVTVATIIIVLLLRKAIIVLLIVLSPIAFVLYLLPNTERLFNKWMKMFTQILMVFPVVGLLFGAGQLASTIVLVSGSQGGADIAAKAAKCNPNAQKNALGSYDDADTKAFYDAQKQNPGSYDSGNCGGGAVSLSDSSCKPANNTNFLGTDKCQVTASWTLGLVAMGIAVAPLIAVWSVLKGALSAAGAIGGRLTSMSGRFTQGRRKGLQDAMETRQLQNDANFMEKGGFRGRMANGLTFGGTSRRIRKKALKDSAQGGWNSQYARYVAENAVEDGKLTGFGRQLAGGVGASEASKQRILDNAEGMMQQSLNDEFKQASFRAADMSDADLHAVVDVDLDKIDVNDPQLAAAIDQLGKRGDFGRLEKLLDAIAHRGPSLSSRTIASTLNENAGQMFTGGQIANIARGAHTESYMDTVANNLASGVLTAEKMSTLNPSQAGEISHVAASAASSPEIAQKLANNNKSVQDIFNNLASTAVAVQGDQILNKRISRINDQLTSYASGAHSRNTTR